MGREVGTGRSRGKGNQIQNILRGKNYFQQKEKTFKKKSKNEGEIE